MTKLLAAPERVAARSLLARFLVGAGVELGPGHMPFPLPFPGGTIRYIDKWDPEKSRTLFPELGEEAEFPRPDIIADLDTDRLAALGDGSQDFVIASHVLEHVAEPLGLLEDIHRTLRPGGIALVLLPDRRYTFDVRRQATPLSHLVDEYQRRVTVVDDDHIKGFLRELDDWDETLSPEEQGEVIQLHRDRSIHVHCWTESEFMTLLSHTISSMDMHWELLDATFAVDEVRMEFGFALRRSAQPGEPALAATRFEMTFEALQGYASDIEARIDTLTRDRDEHARELMRTRQELLETTAIAKDMERRSELAQEELDLVYSSVAWQMTSTLQTTARRIAPAGTRRQRTLHRLARRTAALFSRSSRGPV
jgi:SAM-dependent methyltransferase